MKLLGAAAILIVVCMVPARIALLRRRGIAAMKFGKTDRTDFLIPPFALLYLYFIFAGALGRAPLQQRPFFASVPLQWAGALFCVSGLVLFALSLVSFGSSFRVGIDTDNPDHLVTSGVFELTRNPIYVAFGFLLLGEFFIQPSWITLLYFIGAMGVIHRQVLREEACLKELYGREYEAYCESAPRYLWR